MPRLAAIACTVSIAWAAGATAAEVRFPAKFSDGSADRQALLCVPKTPPPHPVVVFNHGSIVDMVGWPKAAFRERGRPYPYLLDRICSALAEAGYLAFMPIRENTPLGQGAQDYREIYREVALAALDHVKRMPEADLDRIALAGFSMGGLVSFAVAMERSDLRAVALLAPAAGRGKLGEVAKGADTIAAPVLAMIEKDDNPPIHRSIEILERALGSRGKPFSVIRYDRGGGHELFYDVGYWWDDFKAFLAEHLSKR